MKTLIALLLALPCVAHASAPELRGTWVSEACESVANADGTKTFFKRTFKFERKSWSVDFSTFGDDRCSDVTRVLTVDVSGKYTVGQPSAVAGAFDADFLFSARSVFPRSESAAATMSGAKLCSFAKWQLGGARNIHQSGCAAVGAWPLKDCKGEHDIVKLDGDKLWFGVRPADGNLCTPDKRPSSLQSVAVVRQGKNEVTRKDTR